MSESSTALVGSLLDDCVHISLLCCIVLQKALCGYFITFKVDYQKNPKGSYNP